MNASFEKRLMDIVEPLYRNGRDGLKEWFRTPAAIQLSRKLAEEMGLFD